MGEYGPRVLGHQVLAGVPRTRGVLRVCCPRPWDDTMYGPHSASGGCSFWGACAGARFVWSTFSAKDDDPGRMCVRAYSRPRVAGISRPQGVNGGPRSEKLSFGSDAVKETYGKFSALCILGAFLFSMFASVSGDRAQYAKHTVRCKPTGLPIVIVDQRPLAVFLFPRPRDRSYLSRSLSS